MVVGRHCTRGHGPHCPGGDDQTWPAMHGDPHTAQATLMDARERIREAGGDDARPVDHGRLDRAEPLAEPARVWDRGMTCGQAVWQWSRWP